MSIDNRIVQMQFDNKKFEENIKDSIKSLNNLKSGLDLDGASRSLSNLERAGRSFSLAGISEGVQHISSKFTALGIIGITALQNITNSAINAGKRMISALTIDPIKLGLSEYETKINAIQTILTNTKASTLEDVTKVLNELNEYADKTIYNFAEMTRNIGTFTAAGIGLEESATAIKGIANLAAGSGSNAQQASTAMYQLSQALAAGSVKLQDWNSIVNAGMGGQLFQNALRQTAKEMGVMVDETIPFRESLQSGWITAEVLTKTLAKFAEDESLIKAATQVKTFTQLFNTMKESVQSGWAQSWESIIGNKDQATEFFTAVNDGFGAITGASAEARNEMLAFWNANGGRDAIIEALSNSFKALQDILTPIKEAFREIFPPMTGQRLVEISEAIRDVTRNFKIGDETSNNLKRTFKGLFAAADIVRQVLKVVVQRVGDLIELVLPLGDGLLDVTGSFGDFLVSLNETIKSTDAINVAFDKTIAFIVLAAKKIGEAVETIITKLGPLGEFLEPIVGKIKEYFGSIVGVFTSFGTIDLSGLNTFSDKVKKAFDPFAKAVEAINKVFDVMVGFAKKVGSIFKKIGGFLADAFGVIKDQVSNATKNLGFDSVLDIVNGGILAAILFGVKKFIDSLTEISLNGTKFVDGIKGILDGVKGSLEAYQSQLKAGTLTKIAVAIAILAAALVVLSMIDPEKLTYALGAMTAMFIELFGAMTIFNKLVSNKGFGGMGKLAIGMAGLAVGVLILSTALMKLSELDWNGIGKGLAGIAGITAVLVATAKLLDGSSAPMIKASIGFIALGAALLLIINAVKTMGEMDTDVLIKGVAGVGLILMQLAIVTKLLGSSKVGIASGIGFLAFAQSMKIMAGIIAEFGNMSWEQIAKGLITMSGALAAVTTAVNLMPKGMIAKGTGLTIVATALLILSGVLKSMGGLSWEVIAKGLIAMAASLTVIAVAMNFMTTALPGAAALLVIVGALALFLPVLTAFGLIPMSVIGKGIIALAGSFTVIGIAGLLLGPLTPIILALGAAIALFGVGCLAVGAGMLAFSVGLTALAAAGTAGAAALTLAITSIVKLIPFILETLAKGIINFVRVLGEGAPEVAKAFVSIVTALVLAVSDVIPVVVEALYKMLTKILDTLVEYVPKIVDAGFKLIIGFLKGIADNIGEVVKTAIEIVVNFIDGVASMIPKVIQSGVDLILSFINGIADAIRGNTDPVINAVKNLMSAVREAAWKVLKASISGFLDLGEKIMDSGFITGVKNKISSFVSSVKGLAVDGIRALTAKIGDFKDVGKNIIGGLINGVKDMATNVVDSVKGVIDGAINGAKKLLGIKSPSRVFAEMGKYMDQGMANGLKKFSGLVGSASEGVGKTAKESLRSTLSNIASLISGDLDMSPTIRPVLDLSNVEAGARRIDGVLGANKGISVSTSSNKASSIASGLFRQNTNSGHLGQNGGDSSKSVVNTFNIANLVVREEADIKKVARQLRLLQLAGERG